MAFNLRPSETSSYATSTEVDVDAEFVIGGEFVPMNGLKRFPCVVHDGCEGTIRVSVQAADADDARDQAEIAAAVYGCSNIYEITVGREE